MFGHKLRCPVCNQYAPDCCICATQPREQAAKKIDQLINDWFGSDRFTGLFNRERLSAFATACASIPVAAPEAPTSEQHAIIHFYRRSSDENWRETTAEHIAHLKKYSGFLYRTLYATPAATVDAQADTTTASADPVGDRWHSLTCDGTCSPPCDAATTASAQQSKVDFGEYARQCAADGTVPMPFSEFKATTASASGPDQAAFEAQAKYQGASDFTLADNMQCSNSWFPATYENPMTELAWRVWANKSARAVLTQQSAAQAAPQEAARYRLLRDAKKVPGYVWAALESGEGLDHAMDCFAADTATIPFCEPCKAGRYSECQCVFPCTIPVAATEKKEQK